MEGESIFSPCQEHVRCRISSIITLSNKVYHDEVTMDDQSCDLSETPCATRLFAIISGDHCLEVDSYIR
jgi:hypothetical protein